MTRWIVAVVSAGLAVLLGLWPLSHRYTSLGLDLEQADGPSRARCTFYRLRWPGDGSVCVGRLVTHRPAHAKPLARFDLGGRFFQPAMPTTPATAWNRLGFWWITDPNTPAAAAPAMAPGASEVVLVGVPHWLAVAVAGASAYPVWRRRSRRTRAGVLQSPGSPAKLGDR
jgi:hypothetical protein